MLPGFFDSVLDLIVKTSTDLPPDVRAAMKGAMGAEQPGTRSAQALTIIAQNIDQAAADEGAICQDTGMPTFEVHVPRGADQIWMRTADSRGRGQGDQARQAEAEFGRLDHRRELGRQPRPRHADHPFRSVGGRRDRGEADLLKGGGCENMNIQYSLPAELPNLGRADRTLEGVRKCILHAVWNAQGKGCAPGAIGVCIGGDRTSGYLHAKEQLFRTLDDVNPDARLADLEATIMGTVNTLGIGTMGFGGNVSLIGCKIGVLNRLPASFFVSVAYDCWAFRRLGVRLDARDGSITRWLYRDPSNPMIPMIDQEGFARTGREIRLTAPLDEATVRSLKVGDVVLVSGRMYTGRDAVHAHLMKHEPPVDLNGSVLYHCGPVVKKEGDGWKVTAAGPTTSIREEPYQAEILRRYGVRAVIGKGGMGAKTLQGLKDSGAVYLNAVGGAAQFYARCIERTDDVSLMEFGTPEAMWHLWVRDFPAIVTMDAHGNSLHKDLEAESGEKLAAA